MSTQRALIEAYIAQNTPFTPRISYKSVMLLLATNLAKVIECDTSPDYYCYIYLDPRCPGLFEYVLPSGKVVKFKFRPFYVGKGKNDRYKDHMNEIDTENVSNKLTILRELAELGLEPIIKIMKSRVEEDVAFAIEIDLIAGIGRIGRTGPLTNVSNGGTAISIDTLGLNFSSYIYLYDVQVPKKLPNGLSVGILNGSGMKVLRLQTNDVMDASYSVAKQVRKIWMNRITDLKIQSLIDDIKDNDIGLTHLTLKTISTRKIEHVKVSSTTMHLGTVDSADGYLKVHLAFGWFRTSQVKGDKIKTLRDLIHYKKTTWADLVETQADRLLKCKKS